MISQSNGGIVTEVEIESFKILAELGQGGMGTVYDAVHEATGQRVALKVFSATGASKDFLRKRFLAEGRMLLRLKHPRLVQVYDVGVDTRTQTPYYAMDPVLGPDGTPCTLEAYRHRSEFDERTVVRIYRELCEALAFLHEQGVVHRDVKLENVLVDSSGHLHLADFGISRIFDEDFRHQIAMTTTSGGDKVPIMGSVGYLAPEVKRGEPATPASDAWALGVLVFRLLTGVWYESESAADELLAGFSEKWKQVLGKLLSPDPALRLPLPSMTPGTSSPRCKVMVWLFVGLVLSVGVGLTLRRLQGDEPSTYEETEASLPKVITLDLQECGELEFCYCPPGPVDVLVQSRYGETCRVEVTRPYWTLKYPMTRLQCSYHPNLSYMKGESYDLSLYMAFTRGTADEIARYLTRTFRQQLPDGYEVRLPTLAEWERAFHADTTDRASPYFDLTRTNQRPDVLQEICYGFMEEDAVRTKRLNDWGLGDWCGWEKVADTLPIRVLPYNPPADFSHDIPGTVALPPVPSLRDPLWQCADTNALTVCRSIRWGGWTVYPKARDVDWSAFRYVIGPKLNSSEDVR